MRRRGFLQAIGGTALAAMAPPAAVAGSLDSSRLLVLVDLQGGNDGLNTVVPYADPAYCRLRPTLAIRREAVLPLDERVGLHPALAPLLPLWRAGEMAILQGVGHPDPSLSHFRSQEIWASATLGADAPQKDWLGQALGSNRRQLRFRDGSSRPDPTADGRGDRALSQPAGPVLHNHAPQGDFGRDVATACDALSTDSTVAVIRLVLDGFDTHLNQAPEHAAKLAELASGLSALRARLDELGRWDSTLVLTHSEFGRRVVENPSAGTDHGTVAAHFALGGGVRGGLYGKSAELATLDGNGNLVFGLDFRAIYTTVLERWLKVPASPVLGRRFATDNFLRA